MSEIKSTSSELDDDSCSDATVKLPTLQLSDVVPPAETSMATAESVAATESIATAGSVAIAESVEVAEPLDEASEWIAEMESEIDGLRSRWQEVDAALHRSEQRAIDLAHQLSAKDIAISDLEKNLGEALHQIAERDEQLARLNQRDDEREESFRELNRSLQSNTAMTEMLRADLGKRDAELQAAQADLAAARERIKAKDRQVGLRESKFGQLEARIAEQDRQLALLRDEKVDLYDELQTLRKDLKLKQSIIDAFDKGARRLTDLNQSIKRRTGRTESDASLVIEAAHIFEHAAVADATAASNVEQPFAALAEGVRHMIIQGEGKDRRFYPLTEDEMTIGRARDCDICIADETISRVHARFEIGDEGPQIVDAGSTNGIRVNDREVTSARLQHGDTISLAGTLQLTYVEVDQPGESA